MTVRAIEKGINKEKKEKKMNNESSIYREFISEFLSGPDWTLGNPSNTIHPWCSLHVQTMPMNCHGVTQQQVMYVYNHFLILINDYGRTRNDIVDSNRHSVVSVYSHDTVYRNLMKRFTRGLLKKRSPSQL